MMPDKKEPVEVTAAIEPCPFCGAALSLKPVSNTAAWFHPGVITDRDCFMSGKGVMLQEVERWNTRIAAEQAASRPCGVGEMAAFGASDAACCFYPGEDQQLERAAFCAGAAYAVSRPAEHEFPADGLALLRKAADTFRRYEGLHRAKGTPEAYEKSKANGELAHEIECYLNIARPAPADQRDIQRWWGEFINCQDDRYFGNGLKMDKQLAVIRKVFEAGRKSALASLPAHGWQSMETAPKDGGDILILAHGMVIEARYAPGEWSHGIDGSEYDGPVWVAFDDALQFEIEETPEGDFHGPVTAWMPKPAPPTDPAPSIVQDSGGEG